jgi:dolichol-phosphate mannosyltransferase
MNMMQGVIVKDEKEYALSSLRERVAIIMPVYNEGKAIESTVRELYHTVANKMDNVDIWVFEDGSTDGTKEVLEKLKSEFPGLHVKMTKERKGYPQAMREAFLSIDPCEYEYVMAIDSDGQYDPNDFSKLWQGMQRNSTDIVMGKRITRREPLYRKLLSRGLQILERLMFPIQCKDVTSVMRLMKVEVAHRLAKEVCYSKYNFWLEFTARMSLNHYRILEVSVAYRERVGGSKVYSIANMPKVVTSELSALRAVKKEYAQRPKLHKNMIKL